MDITSYHLELIHRHDLEEISFKQKEEIEALAGRMSALSKKVGFQIYLYNLRCRTNHYQVLVRELSS